MTSDSKLEILETSDTLPLIDEVRVKELRQKLNALKIEDNIPPGSKVLDIGCDDGALGILAAREGEVIQADIQDRRKYKVGELITLPTDTPPFFNNVDADVALLVDVIHHTGYGNGWDQQRRQVNWDGKVADAEVFLKGVLTGLDDSGKILLLNTRPEAEELVNRLQKSTQGNELLKDRIVYL